MNFSHTDALAVAVCMLHSPPKKSKTNYLVLEILMKFTFKILVTVKILIRYIQQKYGQKCDLYGT